MTASTKLIRTLTCSVLNKKKKKKAQFYLKEIFWRLGIKKNCKIKIRVMRKNLCKINVGGSSLNHASAGKSASS